MNSSLGLPFHYTSLLFLISCTNTCHRKSTIYRSRETRRHKKEELLTSGRNLELVLLTSFSFSLCLANDHFLVVARQRQEDRGLAASHDRRALWQRGRDTTKIRQQRIDSVRDMALVVVVTEACFLSSLATSWTTTLRLILHLWNPYNLRTSL